MWEVREGDALARLREMPDESVQCCVTSPPYFGLRDYGTGSWEGGDAACAHKATNYDRGERADRGNVMERTTPYREACGRCGARRVDRQIGLEPTPDEFVDALVAVFREVRRVLRADGTLWLNLGDSYANSPRGNAPGDVASSNLAGGGGYQDGIARGGMDKSRLPGVKQKDLLGIPWLVAFALRADGWYLRSDIIWAKPNPMPESVTDRPTKAHEYVFLLSKSQRYFYDADAIREGSGVSFASRGFKAESQALRQSVGTAQSGGTGERSAIPIVGRNKRTVWTVATQPYSEAHFATFPPKLIEPCILAGSSPQACGECGAPWGRVVERTPMVVEASERRRNMESEQGARARTQTGGTMTQAPTSQTVGWESSCDHDDDSGRCVVLDPFAGAGTTGLVATRRGRSFVGIELNPTYAEMARNRIRNDAPLLNVPAEVAT